MNKIGKCIPAVVILLLFAIAACKTQVKDADSTTSGKQSPDNFTGIKKFYEGEKLTKEITYKNGIKEGLCNNYYDDGRLKRTIWYSNNIREDTAKWFYPEGKVYRATPYKRDKIHGIRIKYYKNGRKQAEIPYKHGLRIPGLKEYYENGREVGNIPSITHEISEQYYKRDGVLKVFLKLSNESKNVNYYQGALIDDTYDPSKCKDVTASTGMGYIELERDALAGKGYVDVIAVYTTRFRNKEIITKRIKLPYSDLK